MFLDNIDAIIEDPYRDIIWKDFQAEIRGKNDEIIFQDD